MIPRLLPLTTADFEALRKAPPAHVEQHFDRWIASLHDFLNHSPTLPQVQRVRGKRPNSLAFETKPRYCPDHWYTYHRGGRSEAQFNVGMFEDHLRFGIGFEPTGGGYGDPDAIRAAQKRFADALRQEDGGPEAFCARHKLEVEVNARPRPGVDIKEIDHFLDVVDGRAAEEPWIFVGRILRAKKDQEILGDASALGVEMERVFVALWPLWRQSRGLAR
jgi:hypothetical protein